MPAPQAGNLGLAAQVDILFLRGEDNNIFFLRPLHMRIE